MLGRPGTAPPGATTVSLTMRILVVADEDWVLEDVAASLAEARFELTTSSNPHGVVDSCEEIGADAVIVDLQVASMGGMAVIRRVRAAVDAKVLGPTPTILLLDRGADRFIARRAGADGWLRKPFGAFELRSMVDDLVAAATEPA